MKTTLSAVGLAAEQDQTSMGRRLLRGARPAKAIMVERIRIPRRHSQEPAEAVRALSDKLPHRTSRLAMAATVSQIQSRARRSSTRAVVVVDSVAAQPASPSARAVLAAAVLGDHRPLLELQTLVVAAEDPRTPQSVEQEALASSSFPAQQAPAAHEVEPRMLNT
jgi:hypothetical protein